MAKRIFSNDKKYIHIPVHDEHPNNHRYIRIYDGDTLAHEFHIGVAHSGKTRDFYVPLYLGNYQNEAITLVCDDEVPEDFFDGFQTGDAPQKETGLYPDLYREPTRQQIHFSPARGWMNDPNGLFFKDGKFNAYFQHNPFASRHGGVNVSWGHAVSEDGVHFTEYPDAIMPYNSKCSVASGSAFVDVNNLLGKGKGTVIAAYTALQALQYRGRPRVTQNEGQMLLYSLDDGMTFKRFENNPFLSVPDGEYWRDPKILEVNGSLVAIVYEPVGDERSTSVYASKDGKAWSLVSKGEKFHECPDFFEMEVFDGNEKLYVMYGGHGQYSVGRFENFKFIPVEQGGFLDYGDVESVYAGQTFSNYPDPKVRYHTAWLKENGMCCFIADGYVFDGSGFHSSLSLLCKLTLRKTDKGYRIFKEPHENLKILRRTPQTIVLVGTCFLQTPAEYCFTLEGDKPVNFTVGKEGFTYTPATRKIVATSGKSYELCLDGAPSFRLFADTRSLEFFINGEISLTYFATPDTQPLVISDGVKVQAVKYPLDSIWKK